MTRLLVLGNAGIDLVCPVPHLPGVGETVVAGGQSRAPGGKGLNQAVVAARAGAAVLFTAPVGRDAAAAELDAALRAEPLAGVSMLPQDAATDLSLLMVAPDGENSILTLGAAADALTPAAALAALAPLQRGDMLLLQGNLSAPATLAAAQAARARGASVMLNTAPMRWDMRPLLPLCGVVVANDGEAASITGLHGQAAAAALHAMGACCAVVTLGAGGCAVAGPGGLRHYPARPTRAVDTTGAGDTFCGVLAAGLLRGEAMGSAVDAAQRAAALAVSRPGAFAALPTAAELAALPA